MDAFYASVEQLDNPFLKNKPIVVGNSSKRGVVAAASYEARSYGIRSAMSSVIAKHKCKDLIFVVPRFDRYKEISLEIKKVFLEITDLVEPLSLDEAFLDVTGNSLLASQIAFEIRSKIYKRIGLTASAGISINKFVSKIATEVNKPNGQKTIHPQHVDTFLNLLPIEQFYGIGKVTSVKMKENGIFYGSDLRKATLEFLMSKFGKTGSYYYKIIRSTQDNPVNPNRIIKSIGAEKTFRENINSNISFIEKLNKIAEKVEERMIKADQRGKTVTVKIKYEDFTLKTRSKTIKNSVKYKNEFFPIVEKLFFEKNIEKPVRLLGISISGFSNKKDFYSNKTQLKIKF